REAAGDVAVEGVAVPLVAAAHRPLPLVRADGEVTAPVVRVDGVGGGGAPGALRAARHAEDLGLAAVGQGVEEGQRARVVGVRPEVGVEEDADGLGGGAAGGQEESEEEKGGKGERERGGKSAGARKLPS